MKRKNDVKSKHTPKKSRNEMNGDENKELIFPLEFNSTNVRLHGGFPFLWEKPVFKETKLH